MPGSGLKLRAQQTKREAEQVETELLCCLFSLGSQPGLLGGAGGLFYWGWQKSYTPRLVNPPANSARVTQARGTHARRKEQETVEVVGG